ncbi:hypothetical protein L596_001585 [Steinernema carpocapsae]|uniref:Uncharacterized protein n=1 Tax=Steinernema carpocapsae TaxID=34508 RepID=A0A4U8UP94_STECR|nr:hypothetical protein L596_001585 [Steinernema carpocapsae]
MKSIEIEPFSGVLLLNAVTYDLKYLFKCVQGHGQSKITLTRVMLGQSYEDLRTVRSTDENGNETTTVYKTFSEAAKALGLVHDDEEWERCLGDSVFEQMPFQMRALFVLIETQCSPGLYEKFKREMADDYVHRT